MNATDAHTGEAYLAFGQAPLSNTAKAAYAGSLSQTGDTTEAAANLFAMLHRLDAPPYTGIAVAPVPTTGLGLAINDRLHRAAITSRTIAP
jgi:L-threonylcarbamoyladenylate synthase